MVLSSDIGLADNAIEVMLQAKKEEEVEIVYSAYRTYDVSNFENWSSFSFDSYPFRKTFLNLNGKVDAHEILFRFFGSENLKGEFGNFSFFGALFNGELAQRLPSTWRRFKYHGGEQFLSMILLLRGKNVYLLNKDLMLKFFGHPRLGGTERMKGDIGRIECLMASQEILDSYDFWLIGQGADLNLFRQSQIDKANYFLNNYNDFEGYADEVISKNSKLLSRRKI
jgi:hypothetical protein